MAAVSILLGAIYDPSGGTAAVYLNYDNVSLQASSLTFSVAKSLGAPLVSNMIIGGTGYTFQAPPSSNPGQYTFSPPLQGVIATLRFGQYINFGFTAFSFATVGAIPGYQITHIGG